MIRHFDKSPDEHGEPCNRDDDTLRDEQPPDMLWRDEHEGKLEQPVKEITHHSNGSDVRALGETVLHVRDGRPDGFEHLRVCHSKTFASDQKGVTESARLIDTFRTREGLNSEPEHREYNSTDDAEIAEPEAERGAIKYWEWNMEARSNCTVRDHDDSDDDVPNGDGRQSLFPTDDIQCIVVECSPVYSPR